jgi:predicted enzyme related to lactoylglutathione lyase
MTIRDHAPHGAPTWADLWTSDVERSRAFYTELFGWEAGDSDAAFGGYSQFFHEGRPVAGLMGDMGEVKADNTWKPYFESPDITKAHAAVVDTGGTAHFAPEAVGDLGTQFVFSDPAGAVAGLWQVDTFSGFAELGVPGTPSWFELHTRDHAGALAFYAAVCGWAYDYVSDTDEFRYAMVRDPEGDMGMAGIMDNRSDLPEGSPAFWTVYWEVEDVAAAIAKAVVLGGAVEHAAEETPYGQLGSITDPMGARLSLRRANG